jgi:hypothetical protein
MSLETLRIAFWFRQAALALIVVPLAGCAARSRDVVHVAPDESRPHFTWGIRTGGSDGDAEFVCGSSQPEKRCVLAASTDQTRTLAAVHLFVHAAAQPTSYLGFMRAPFLGGGRDRRVGEVNTTVQPGSPPVSTLVIGQVTSARGASALTISLEATQPGAPNPVRLSQEIPVFVK